MRIILQGEYYSHPKLKEIRERNFKKYAVCWKVLGMSDAKICPVCGGSGQLNDPLTQNTTAPTTKQCHGCKGEGWVVVP